MVDERGDGNEHNTVRHQCRQRALELAQGRRMGMADRQRGALAQRDGPHGLELAPDVCPVRAVIEKDVPADRGQTVHPGHFQRNAGGRGVAVDEEAGALFAQALHHPVHVGEMAGEVAAHVVVDAGGEWHVGEAALHAPGHL